MAYGSSWLGQSSVPSNPHYPRLLKLSVSREGAERKELPLEVFVPSPEAGKPVSCLWVLALDPHLLGKEERARQGTQRTLRKDLLPSRKMLRVCWPLSRAQIVNAKHTLLRSYMICNQNSNHAQSTTTRNHLLSDRLNQHIILLHGDTARYFGSPIVP